MSLTFSKTSCIRATNKLLHALKLKLGWLHQLTVKGWHVKWLLQLHQKLLWQKKVLAAAVE